MERIELGNGNYKEIYYFDNRSYYSEETKIQREQYYNSKDKLHRVDSPAVIWYYKSGEIEGEYYYINGKRHRLDGPAQIWYLESGEIEYKYYFINDIEYSKEKFYKHPEVIKIKNINRNLKLLNKK